MSFREVTKADQLKALGYIALMIAFNVLTAVVLAPRAWPWGLIVWLILCFGGSLFLLVRWHAHHTVYRCPACSSEFEISILIDFISPHFLHKKYLKCHRCDERVWATTLMKAK